MTYHAVRNNTAPNTSIWENIEKTMQNLENLGTLSIAIIEIIFK